jgi:hypothetical protein
VGGVLSAVAGIAPSMLPAILVQYPVLRDQLWLLTNCLKRWLYPPTDLKLTEQTFSVTIGLSPQIQFSRKWADQSPKGDGDAATNG